MQASHPTNPQGTDRPASSRPVWLKTALRLGVAALFVGFLIRQGELLSETLAVLERTRWGLYVIGAACYIAGLASSTARLRVLVRGAGHSIPFSRLFTDLIKSTGLNALITPGTGEVYRVGRLRREGLGLAEAGALVFADRAIGLAVIALTAAAGAIAIGAEWTGARPGAATWGLAFALVLLIGSVALFAGARSTRARHFAHKVETSLARFANSKRTLAQLLAWSGPTLLFWIGSVAVFAEALGLEVGFLAIAFAAPLVTMATLIPVSVGGMGVREAGYALLLSPYGVDAPEAVALGLLQYSSFLLVAFVAWALLIADSVGEESPDRADSNLRPPLPGASRSDV